MAILSKVCKPDNFESHNSLKLSFTNIRGLRSNFVDCESFLESNLPDILALCETNLDDSIDSGNFSVRGYLPLIRKDSSTHMHGLAVYVKEGLPFARDLSLENSADFYLCFRLALLHSVSYFFFLYRSPSSSLCTVFDSISSNVDEVVSINPSANVFVFGDFNIHHKDWLTYSGRTDKTKESITSQKLGSRDFWRIANSVLNKSKSAIPPLFNGPEVLSSASDKAKLFAKNFSKNSNLDDSGISLPVFPSRTNLKLHNISITPKMVKKVIMNLDSSKASGPDCIPVLVLKNCEPELSYILAKLFNKCLKESCFPDCWKVSSVVPVFKNVGERSTAKNYRPVSLLSVVSKVFEKLVNNRIVDHLEKCGLFSDFQYGFRSSRLTADLLTVVSDRIARAFNRSGATRAVALDISKAFDRVWHAGLLHKLKSY